MNPQIKASYFAGNLAALSALGATQETAARAALRAEIDAFAQLSRADWVPLAWDIALTRVCRELGGDAAIRAVNRRSFLQGVDGPLLRPFLGAAVTMLRVGPRPFLRVFASGWASSTRDLGRIEVYGESDDDLEVGMVGLPPVALADRPWLEGFCGVLEAVIEISRMEGTVDPPRVVDGRALFGLRYRRRA